MTAAAGPSIERFEGVVQDYAWGDLTAIPALLGVEPSGAPQAELWMGAHPKAPGRLADGRSLADAIDADPEGTLGAAAVERFGRLPFLFKVLAASQPLSIQAHPSLAQARAGFARENEAGVALDAPTRTYRDDNHKPELICALTPFEALCGFRSVAETQSVLAGIDDPAFEPLRARLELDGLGATVAWLLGSSDPAVAAMVEALGRRPSTTTTTAADAVEVAAGALGHYPGDAGAIVTLLLHHIRLEPGQAVFLDAGNLHAYLRGVGVELMANSDNVVRGGLTPKHVDVDELLSIVSFEPLDPPVQSPSGAVHRFAAPVPEFSLVRVAGDTQSTEVTVVGPEIVLVTEGTFELRAATRTDSATRADSTVVALSRGETAIVWHRAGNYTLTGTGTAWRATVGATTPS